jgi:hypothetical protein
MIWLYEAEGGLRPVAGRRESVRAKPDPGEEGDQGERVMDPRIEEILRPAEQHGLQAFEHR